MQLHLVVKVMDKTCHFTSNLSLSEIKSLNCDSSQIPHHIQATLKLNIVEISNQIADTLKAQFKSNGDLIFLITGATAMRQNSVYHHSQNAS